MYRVGIGYDAHRLVEGRPLIIGGVKIEHTRGLAGHSDADVLIHAIIDALLGAAGLGDIGTHFPDTAQSYKGISSLVLLEKVGRLLTEKDYSICNIDGIIIAQEPKMRSYIPIMEENISVALGIDRSRVNIKATTTEGMGFEGRKEGIGAQAVAFIREKHKEETV